MSPDILRLNLGCADRGYTGFIGVDIAPGPHVDQVVDLAGPWPWETSSVAEVMALDVCEHIGDCDHARLNWLCDRCAHVPRPGFPLLQLALQESGIVAIDPVALREHPGYRHPLGRPHFMNELWRVLKPGGLARIETPNASRGSGFFQDPTHVMPYCLSSFKYFEEGAFARQRLGDAYGITARFKVREISERETSGEENWSRPEMREKAWKITAYLEAIK